MLLRDYLQDLMVANAFVVISVKEKKLYNSQIL